MSEFLFILKVYWFHYLLCRFSNSVRESKAQKRPFDRTIIGEIQSVQPPTKQETGVAFLTLIIEDRTMDHVASQQKKKRKNSWMFRAAIPRLVCFTNRTRQVDVILMPKITDLNEPVIIPWCGVGRCMNWFLNHKFFCGYLWVDKLQLIYGHIRQMTNNKTRFSQVVRMKPCFQRFQQNRRRRRDRLQYQQKAKHRQICLEGLIPRAVLVSSSWNLEIMTKNEVLMESMLFFKLFELKRFLRFVTL